MPSRRQVLAGLGSASTAALAGCLGDDVDFSPGTDANTDWPMPRYDRANNAYSPDAKAPRDGVRERWTYEDGNASTGPPVVADGVAYLPTNGALVALDTTTGDEQWRFTPSDHPWIAPPVVHDGMVYVTEVTTDGVYALDANSGEEVWSFADAGNVDAGVHLLAGERIFEPVLYAGSENGGLFRLDAKTGELTWQTDLFGNISTMGYRRSTLYVGTQSGEVYAFQDTVDGVAEPTEGWRQKVGSTVRAVLPTGEGVLVHTFADPLQCLQTGLHAGTTRWTMDEKLANSAPVSANYTVFTAGYERLAAFPDYDKETKWELDGRYDGTGPVAAGDTLYVSSSDDKAVHGFALDGGVGAFGVRFDAKRWSHSIQAVPEGLAVADGALFVACGLGRERNVTLYCLESA